MRRGFSVIIAIVVTFYLAVIYKSESLVFLGYAELIVISLLLLYNLLVFCRIRIFLETPMEIAELHQEIPVRIVVRNYGFLPTGKIAVKIDYEYMQYKKKTHVTFGTTVIGRIKRQEAGYSTSIIQTSIPPKHIGKVKIRIRKARSYDLLGILSLPVRRKRRMSQSEIMILPKRYSVPVEIGRKSQAFLAERECFEEEELREEAEQDFQIRSYRPGDKIRSIHWKLSAKMEDLMVHERTEKTGCPILFYLDITDKMSGKKKRKQYNKKEAKKIEAFYSVLLSVSDSMIQNDCKHYVIWYDGIKGEVIRYLVEKEEDVYAMFFALDGLWDFRPGIELEEAYREKYGEPQYATKITLNQNLQLICNEEEIYEYQAKKLEEGLTAQEILL